MIQDIKPRRLRNEFKISIPKSDDYVLYYNNNTILLKNEVEPSIPTFQDLEKLDPNIYQKSDYLFEVDGSFFFLINASSLIDASDFEANDLKMCDAQSIRSLQPMWLAFASITGKHLYHFYQDNHYCGRCGKEMKKSKVERALCCESCNNIVYPKISPVIMVAITDGDRILLTRYSNGAYKRYGLVAGFVEIGETLEQTIEREVMEEVGLKVKNIRYYKNQPWAFSSSLIAGFFADLDGSDQVTLDENELAEAVWVNREDIPENPIKISLANEMMEVFQNGMEP